MTLEKKVAEEFLTVGREAARQAGAWLMESLDRATGIRYKGSGYRNPYSHADERAEAIITGVISGAFPGHGFITEERGQRGLPADYTWVIDPLDGTVNFLHGYRHFGVSIALLHRDSVAVGLVYAPVSGEMFTAVRDGGAYLNGEKILVSRTDRLDQSLLAVGFPYDRQSAAFERSVRYFLCLLRDSQAMRRHGSTALALADVACGRFDGFGVAGNELWDYAAGTLLVTEAGGTVTDFQGGPFRLDRPESGVLASNGRIHPAIVARFSGAV
ncbi:MAG: inositol monophosphatase family protein [Chloroflexota bacterium]